MKKSGKLVFFVIAFLLSLFVILFVGYDKGKMILTSQGIFNFKKGLDVAGGVRLTYKVDLSKYKELYANDDTQYRKVRQQVETIILKNIDNRISKLGVSDYSAYIQILNNEDYIVVEIGGLKDIAEAKETIGKTVELEFKVPFESGSDNKNLLVERETNAKTLFEDVKKSPDLFGQLGTGRQSEDIYYEDYTGNSISQLPSIVAENKTKLDALSTGQILPELLSGVHSAQFDGSSITVLNGWTMVKMNGKISQPLDSVDDTKISEVVKAFDLKKQENYIKTAVDVQPGKYKYDQSKDEILVNLGEQFSGQDAYDVRIYMYEKQDSLGKQADEIAKINEEAQKSIDEIKNSLDKGEEVNTTGGKVVFKGWTDKASLAQSITGFSVNSGETLKTFDEGNTTYIVKINGSKTSGETLIKTVSLTNIAKNNLSAIQSSLNTKEVYALETIFVKDTPTWITAKDPSSGEILNGGNFRYAGIEQGKTGTPVVTIQFDDKGKEIFCNLTQHYVGKRMAIFVGGEIKTAPNINEKICGGSAQIDGNFTSESAKKLVNDLNEGALPAKLILANEDKISPSLGDNAIKGSILAGIGGFALIFFLLFYMYGFKKAAIAITSLIIYLTILFAIVKLIGYALSLSGIAALLLNIGMGVDANILIFERMKEEIKSGKSLSKAIQEGQHRSWPAIRDGNLTIAFIGLLLYAIGTNIFKGFGFMMLVNILLTLFILVPLTGELLMYVFVSKDSKKI